MRIWISTKFDGHYPVGVAAVVIAHDVDEACSLLAAQLRAHGLKQEVTPEMLTPVSPNSQRAIVLNDGDY